MGLLYIVHSDVRACYFGPFVSCACKIRTWRLGPWCNPYRRCSCRVDRRDSTLTRCFGETDVEVKGHKVDRSSIPAWGLRTLQPALGMAPGHRSDGIVYLYEE